MKIFPTYRLHRADWLALAGQRPGVGSRTLRLKANGHHATCSATDARWLHGLREATAHLLGLHTPCAIRGNCLYTHGVNHQRCTPAAWLHGRSNS